MSSRQVQVVPYNPLWPSMFKKEAEEIKTALGENCIEIHHIGSTSIPGISAKPTIDIIPAVKDILAVDQEATSKLEKLGYSARGELGMPFRRFFNKGEPIRSYHLHIWEEGNSQINKNVLFRDYMRANTLEAKNYEDLKLELAVKFPEDRNSYTAGKEDYINGIYDKIGFNETTILQVHPLLNYQSEAYYRIRQIEQFAPIEIKYDTNHPSFSALNHFHFVFSKGTKIIGALQIELLQNHAIIRSIVIDKPYQKQGYDSELLSLAKKWIKHQIPYCLHP